MSTKQVAKKVVNKHPGGTCGFCGDPLRANVYVLGENTGCTKRCAEQAYAEEHSEFDDETLSGR